MLEWWSFVCAAVGAVVLGWGGAKGIVWCMRTLYCRVIKRIGNYKLRRMLKQYAETNSTPVPDATQLHALWRHYDAHVGPDASDLNTELLCEYVIMPRPYRRVVIRVRGYK